MLLHSVVVRYHYFAHQIRILCVYILKYVLIIDILSNVYNINVNNWCFALNYYIDFNNMYKHMIYIYIKLQVDSKPFRYVKFINNIIHFFLNLN